MLQALTDKLQRIEQGTRRTTCYLIPASATSWLARYSSKSLVEGDYSYIDIFFAFGDGIFGLQLGPLSIQQREKINYAFAIAQAGNVCGALALASLIVQFDEPRLLCVVIRQRIFRFFKSPKHGFFIEGQSLFRGSAGTTHASACPA